MIAAPGAQSRGGQVQALLTARQRAVQLFAGAWSQALGNAAYAYEAGCRRRAGAPRHWKSGGASRQATLTHAPLPPAGVRSSPADRRDRPLHTRGIEAEIALRLGEDVAAERAAELTAAAVAALVDAMAVSIEIVESPWLEGTGAAPLLRLADLPSHGALVLGEWRPYGRHDWLAPRCEVRIGAALAAVFTRSHALADPSWLLPTWLRHATRQWCHRQRRHGRHHRHLVRAAAGASG